MVNLSTNRIDFSRQAVSRWENEESIPTVETIKMISEKFGVSTEVLLNVERNKICQSCTYPLNNIDELGTNADGTLNSQRPGVIVL